MAQQHQHSAIIRQLFDSASSTYSYLVWDSVTHDAVFIDSVREQHARDAKLIEQLGLKIVYLIDTHVHADHVTNAGPLRDELNHDASGDDSAPPLCSRLVLSADSGASADVLVRTGDRLEFGTRHLEVRQTPGHTNGCMSLVLDDHTAVFTGDALLIRGCGRTDFQQGCSKTLFRSVHEQLFSLPNAATVWPGHDYHGYTCSSIGEEKRFNARLFAEQTEQGFVDLMANLKLQPPKQIDVAVPLNLRNGYPLPVSAAPSSADAGGRS